jgi:RHH-type rel operon transcriptional repressor/antitoxin RelB
MLALRLDPQIEERLDLLAKKTGRTKSYYAREAILEHLDDLEDAYLALHRLERAARTYSAKEVKRALGL